MILPLLGEFVDVSSDKFAGIVNTFPLIMVSSNLVFLEHWLECWKQ
jgi:hypothetical protein